MAKRLPKSVQILGVKYKVQLKKDLVDEGVDCDGLCSSSTRTIFIESGLEPKFKFDVLIHEMLHAILYESGYSDVLEASGFNLEEGIVLSLEHGLSRVLDLSRAFK